MSYSLCTLNPNVELFFSSSGSANIPWYSPAMTVKYLIRQVKTMDRLIRRAFKSRVDADENEDTQNAALHKFFEGDDEETDNGPRPRGVPREKFPKKPIISLLLLLGNVLQIARNQTAAIGELFILLGVTHITKY
jgi:hypothetical protein